MELTEQIIAAHPFWSEFRLEHLPILRKCGSLVEYDAGQELFHEGHEADAFYLVRRGKVQLHISEPNRPAIPIHTVEAGGELGFSWLFEPHQWHFGAQVLEPSELIRFEAEPLRKFMKSNAEFGRELAMRVGQVVLERLESTRRHLVSLGAPGGEIAG